MEEVAGGVPRLAAAIAWLACSVRSIADGAGAVAGAGPASHVLVVGEVVEVGASDRLGRPDPDDSVLAMGDTRMNYGG